MVATLNLFCHWQTDYTRLEKQVTEERKREIIRILQLVKLKTVTKEVNYHAYDQDRN
jgi:hypothetical protein